jgi:hypothetical protein
LIVAEGEKIDLRSMSDFGAHFRNDLGNDFASPFQADDDGSIPFTSFQ